MSSKETAEAILIVIKRLGKWVTLLVLALVLIFSALYSYDRVEEYYKNRPQLVKSLKGIELGEKFQDFMFRNAGFVLDADRNKRATDVIYYGNKDKTTAVAIADNKVVRVLYACMEKYDYSSVNGIDCNSTGDAVFEKYEKKIQVQCLRDKDDDNYLRYRVYGAIEFGIRYHVVSNEVIAFDIATPAELRNLEGFMNKNWTICE